MNAGFFPAIEGGSVLAVRAAIVQLRRFPGWLDIADCPYDEATKVALRDLNRALPASSVEVPEDPADTQDNWLTLERDTRTLLAELQGFAREIPAADAKERMAYFRTATSLMEKLVELAERSLNLKQMSDFQRAVLAVFDQILDPQQRTAAMRLMKEGA